MPLLERAGRVFSPARIVSERSDDTTHRHTYGDFYQGARALAAAPQELGPRRGDRVATLMWNNYAHLEAYVSVSA